MIKTYLQNRNRHTDLKNELVVPQGKDQGVLDGQVYTGVLKTNKDLLCGPGNSAQCYVEAWMGWSLAEDGYMYYDG